jgi:hypothetical protein
LLILNGVNVTSYFDPLADLLPPGGLDKVNEAVTAHTWHGAGNQAEAGLLHGVRACVELVKAEAEAAAEAKWEARHRELKRHYAGLEEREKAANEAHRKRLTEKVEHQLKAYVTLHQLALTARAARRKTVPADKLIEAVGLEPWKES